jgi:hypothetical protein
MKSGLLEGLRSGLEGLWSGLEGLRSGLEGLRSGLEGDEEPTAADGYLEVGSLFRGC